jgi:hypothetical protein
MSDNTKEGLVLWGAILFLVIPAVAYSMEHFGDVFGCLIFIPIVILGRWFFYRLEDLHYLKKERDERDERLRREFQEKSEDGE